MKKAVVILPTYNEKENIATLIPAIFEAAQNISDWNISILVVDDKSPDHTFEAVKKMQKTYPHLFIIRGEKEGLGNAYFRGFSYVINQLHADVAFEMDADWSHDPKLIPVFLHKIEKGADFVVGSRYIKGGSIPHNWGLHRKLFSILGNLIIKYGFMTMKVNDWTSGYRCIKTWFLKKIIHQMTDYSGYVFQVAILDRARKSGLNIVEIPLQFKDRYKGKSKIRSVQFISNTLLYVVSHSSFVKYVIVGLVGFSIDFTISFILIEKIKLAIWISTVISGEIAIMFNFLINNFWSFAHKKIERTRTAYLSKFMHFNLISLGSIFIQTVLLSTAAAIFPHQWWFIYKALIIALFIVPYSYFMYNFVVWKKIAVED